MGGYTTEMKCTANNELKVACSLRQLYDSIGNAAFDLGIK